MCILDNYKKWVIYQLVALQIMHITFDTLEAVRRLVGKGLTQQQAEEVVAVMKDVQNDLATKKDLEMLELRLVIKLGLMIAAAIAVITTLLRIF